MNYGGLDFQVGPFPDTTTDLKHTLSVLKPFEQSFKLILNGRDAISTSSYTDSQGFGNRFQFFITAPTTLEGGYNLYVDDFISDVSPSTTANVGTMELYQTKSYSSKLNNNHNILFSTNSKMITASHRPVQVVDGGLFLFHQLTVDIYQYSNGGSPTSLGNTWQLNIFLEKC